MVNFCYESLAYKALPIIMAMLLPSISQAQRITMDAPVLSSYADTEATTNVDGVVFTGAIPAAMFNPDWNLMQVTARGLTEPSGIVVNEVLGWGFNVILR